MTPVPRCLWAVHRSGNGSGRPWNNEPTVLTVGEFMPRKRLEGRSSEGSCRAHNSDSARQEQKNRPSRARPDAGY
ncbi:MULTISPECIES: hypothetical protein [Salmonella]|uniref:Uncharacterized protein n=1 Tax=Salmonella enterica TaxID=28901 RepID=A0A754F8E4_SALER|nr:hypothetical protein [Salmonella enterica]MZI59081.1 hypothetical protein [Salmonella sp. XN2]HAF8570581.1 hypothetical protein [Salmonella enterica]HAF8627419.1 hypothetical protein [Salmonella enterica]HAF9659536.1 hypothetical protein [Salmonella enterica]HAG2929976.1 hypothetical protein [Salmonella enterica]